ncbi:MAG: MFS transporter [Actinomycetota bacterium]|nr:MFS transporter [Actinomycetota bacterium]
MGEGIFASVLVLAAGSFTIIGASANAPLISQSLNLSEVGVGAIASVAYLGALVTAPMSGRLTDRSGPAPVILVGLLSLALGSVLAGLSWTAAVFYLGILVAGFGYGAVNPATTVLANPATARRRGLVMSIKQSGVPVGGIVAGAVLPTLGLALGWRWAFALTSAVCLAIGLGIFVRGGYQAQTTKPQGVAHLSHRRMRLPYGLVFGLIIAGIQVSLFAFTAIYLVQARGFSASAAGLGVSTLLLGGLIGRPFWGWLSDLVTRHRLMVLEGIGLLGAAFIVALALVPDELVLATLVLLGVCSVGWNGVYIAVVAESTEPGSVGRSTGTSLALINAGAIAFPVIIGTIVGWSDSWVVGLLVLGGLSLAATLVAVATSERVPDPAAVLPGTDRWDLTEGGRT